MRSGGAEAIRNSIQLSDHNGLVNNYSTTWPAENITTIHAFKIDHSFSSKFKLSGYYSLNSVNVGSFYDGLAVPLSTGRFFAERTHTIRLNADYTISPTGASAAERDSCISSLRIPRKM